MIAMSCVHAVLGDMSHAPKSSIDHPSKLGAMAQLRPRPVRCRCSTRHCRQQLVPPPACPPWGITFTSVCRHTHVCICNLHGTWTHVARQMMLDVRRLFVCQLP